VHNSHLCQDKNGKETQNYAFPRIRHLKDLLKQHGATLCQQLLQFMHDQLQTQIRLPACFPLYWFTGGDPLDNTRQRFEQGVGKLIASLQLLCRRLVSLHPWSFVGSPANIDLLQNIQNGSRVILPAVQHLETFLKRCLLRDGVTEKDEFALELKQIREHVNKFNVLFNALVAPDDVITAVNQTFDDDDSYISMAGTSKEPQAIDGV